MRDAVKGIDNYKDILRDAPDPLKREDFNVSTRYIYIFFNIKSQTKRTLDDIMYEDECRRYALAFDGQGSYSVNLLITLIFIKLFIFFQVFYSYLKLKE